MAITANDRHLCEWVLFSFTLTSISSIFNSSCLWPSHRFPRRCCCPGRWFRGICMTSACCFWKVMVDKTQTGKCRDTLQTGQEDRTGFSKGILVVQITFARMASSIWEFVGWTGQCFSHVWVFSRFFLQLLDCLRCWLGGCFQVFSLGSISAENLNMTYLRSLISGKCFGQMCRIMWDSAGAEYHGMCPQGIHTFGVASILLSWFSELRLSVSVPFLEMWDCSVRMCRVRGILSGGSVLPDCMPDYKSMVVLCLKPGQQNNRKMAISSLSQ